MAGEKTAKLFLSQFFLFLAIFLLIILFLVESSSAIQLDPSFSVEDPTILHKLSQQTTSPLQSQGYPVLQTSHNAILLHGVPLAQDTQVIDLFHDSTLDSAILQTSSAIDTISRVQIEPSLSQPPENWQETSISINQNTTLDMIFFLAPTKKQKDHIFSLADSIADPQHSNYRHFGSNHDISQLLQPNEGFFADLDSFLVDHFNSTLASHPHTLSHTAFQITLPLWLVQRLLDCTFHVYQNTHQRDYFVLRTLSYSLPVSIAKWIDFVSPTQHFDISLGTAVDNTPLRLVGSNTSSVLIPTLHPSDMVPLNDGFISAPAHSDDEIEPSSSMSFSFTTIGNLLRDSIGTTRNAIRNMFVRANVIVANLILKISLLFPPAIRQLIIRYDLSSIAVPAFSTLLQPKDQFDSKNNERLNIVIAGNGLLHVDMHDITSFLHHQHISPDIIEIIPDIRNNHALAKPGPSLFAQHTAWKLFQQMNLAYNASQTPQLASTLKTSITPFRLVKVDPPARRPTSSILKVEGEPEPALLTDKSTQPNVDEHQLEHEENRRWATVKKSSIQDPASRPVFEPSAALTTTNVDRDGHEIVDASNPPGGLMVVVEIAEPVPYLLFTLNRDVRTSQSTLQLESHLHELREASFSTEMHQTENSSANDKEVQIMQKSQSDNRTIGNSTHVTNSAVRIHEQTSTLTTNNQPHGAQMQVATLPSIVVLTSMASFKDSSDAYIVRINLELAKLSSTGVTFLVPNVASFSPTRAIDMTKQFITPPLQPSLIQLNDAIRLDSSSLLPVPSSSTNSSISSIAAYTQPHSQSSVVSEPILPFVKLRNDDIVICGMWSAYFQHPSDQPSLQSQSQQCVIHRTRSNSNILASPYTLMLGDNRNTDQRVTSTASSPDFVFKGEMVQLSTDSSDWCDLGAATSLLTRSLAHIVASPNSPPQTSRDKKPRQEHHQHEEDQLHMSTPSSFVPLEIIINPIHQIQQYAISIDNGDYQRQHRVKGTSPTFFISNV